MVGKLEISKESGNREKQTEGGLLQSKAGRPGLSKNQQEHMADNRIRTGRAVKGVFGSR